MSPQRRHPTWDQFRVRVSGGVLLAAAAVVYFVRDAHPSLPAVLLAAAALTGVLAARDLRELRSAPSGGEDGVRPPS